jgi:lipopolysaccharide export system protein LptA
VIGLWFAVALAVQEPTPKLPKEPIRDWVYQRKELNPRTSREEVTLILEGAEAIPLEVAKDRETFEVKGVRARYYTDPRKPTDKSEEIRIRADKALMDNGARRLELKENVRVEKGPAASPDSVLHTPSALLRFHRRWVCGACGFLDDKAGPCPVEGSERREKTLIGLECDRDFSLVKPDGLIRGELLSADDAIRELKILRGGFLEICGQPGVAEAPARAVYTQVSSQGPLLLREEDTLTIVSGREGIRVDRIDSTGTLVLTARQGSVVAAATEDPVTKRKSFVPRLVDASGDVKLDGVTFAEGFAHLVTGETLLWEFQPHGDYNFDLARLSSPEGLIEVRTGPNTLKARRLVLDRSTGLARFEGQVKGRLDARKSPGAPPMELACDLLLADLAAGAGPDGRRSLSRVEALGHVQLGGMLSRDGAPPGRAEADRFVWDSVLERGLLEGRPVVRVRQGRSEIVAPRILLESPELMVLKGPKQVHFVQESEGKAEEYRATCEGDLVFDQASGRLSLRHACKLSTGELLLRADRIDATLGKTGKGLEALRARGDLRIRRLKDGTNLYGDRLVYKPQEESFTLYGSPYAVADTGRSSVVQERIQVYEKAGGDGQKVRYTEMIGGKDGIRILIEEKAKPSTGTP